MIRKSGKSLMSKEKTECPNCGYVQKSGFRYYQGIVQGIEKTIYFCPHCIQYWYDEK